MSNLEVHPSQKAFALRLVEYTELLIHKYTGETLCKLELFNASGEQADLILFHFIHITFFIDSWVVRTLQVLSLSFFQQYYILIKVSTLFFLDLMLLCT